MALCDFCWPHKVPNPPCLPLKYSWATSTKYLVQGHQGQVSEQGFKFRGHWLLVKIRPILSRLYFYINTHLHNSSPVACRGKPSRLLLAGRLQTYLWECVGYRVGIVTGWVMPWTRLWEKFAGKRTVTARKRYLVINSEGKLFRKGISV